MNIFNNLREEQQKLIDERFKNIENKESEEEGEDENDDHDNDDDEEN